MKNLKICLVDDDREDKEIFQDAFNELSSGNDLMTFNNGSEMLGYLEKAEQVPDIIFLDLNMPVMGGLEALQELRKHDRYKSISIAIYSTSSSEKDIEQTLIAGANIYITKPTDFQCLKNSISKIMRMQFNVSEIDRDTFVLVL